ncbi:MAG TPA: hypothetical protein DCY81_07750 [Lachnospiraceae bacterium]|jgi:hypothetical protein|nr:hypothetical protein [Lachnospiraceae bacterium]
MYQQDVVLCSASRYTRKFYLNPDFQNLPDEVQKELKVMCVLFTEDVGGIILLMFDENGNLRIVTDAEEDDILFDEIGCDLKVRQLQKTKRELFEQLEEYYNTFF